MPKFTGTVKIGTKTPGEYKWSSYNCYLDRKNYLGHGLDRDLILGLLSEVGATPQLEFVKYMNDEEDNNEFLDYVEKNDEMSEAEAEEILRELLIKIGKDNARGKDISDEIREPSP